MFPLDQRYQAPVAKMFFQHLTRCLGNGWLGDEPYRCVLVGRAQRQGFRAQVRLGRRRRRLGGWRDLLFLFGIFFLQIWQKAPDFEACFFSLGCFWACEDIALVCHWEWDSFRMLSRLFFSPTLGRFEVIHQWWNPRCEIFRTSRKVGSRHPWKLIEIVFQGGAILTNLSNEAQQRWLLPLESHCTLTSNIIEPEKHDFVVWFSDWYRCFWGDLFSTTQDLLEVWMPLLNIFFVTFLHAAGGCSWPKPLCNFEPSRCARGCPKKDATGKEGKGILGADL